MRRTRKMSLPYIPAIENPKADHQLVIRMGGYCGGIAVSCNCLRGPKMTDGREMIEERSRWTTAEALAVYRAYHEQQGITLHG
jgi:hypothetical protein